METTTLEKLRPTARQITVYDERFENPILVALFDNVPNFWDGAEVLRVYGIGPHLCVYADRDDEGGELEAPTQIWRGTRYGDEVR